MNWWSSQNRIPPSPTRTKHNPASRDTTQYTQWPSGVTHHRHHSQGRRGRRRRLRACPLPFTRAWTDLQALAEFPPLRSMMIVEWWVKLYRGDHRPSLSGTISAKIPTLLDALEGGTQATQEPQLSSLCTASSSPPPASWRRAKEGKRSSSFCFTFYSSFSQIPDA